MPLEVVDGYHNLRGKADPQAQLWRHLLFPGRACSHCEKVEDRCRRVAVGRQAGNVRRLAGRMKRVTPCHPAVHQQAAVETFVARTCHRCPEQHQAAAPQHSPADTVEQQGYALLYRYLSANRW
jgi:hypothetical protein